MCKRLQSVMQSYLQAGYKVQITYKPRQQFTTHPRHPSARSSSWIRPDIRPSTARCLVGYPVGYPVGYAAGWISGWITGWISGRFQFNRFHFCGESGARFAQFRFVPVPVSASISGYGLSCFLFTSFWSSLVWSGLVQSSPVMFGLVWSGPVQSSFSLNVGFRALGTNVKAPSKMLCKVFKSFAKQRNYETL